MVPAVTSTQPFLLFPSMRRKPGRKSIRQQLREQPLAPDRAAVRFALLLPQPCRSTAQDAEAALDRPRPSRTGRLPQEPFDRSSRHAFSLRTIKSFFDRSNAFIRKTNPAKDRLHGQYLLDLTGKPVQRLFSKLFPEMKFIRRGKFVKRACSAKELMAKIIVIKKSVQIGSKDAR